MPSFYFDLVFSRELVPVRNDLAIQEDLKPPHQRSVRLLNQLPFPVAVYNVSVSPEARQYFTVSSLFPCSRPPPLGPIV